MVQFRCPRFSIISRVAQSVTDNAMSSFHISTVIPSMPGPLSPLSFCILFKFLLTSSLVSGVRLIFSKSSGRLAVLFLPIHQLEYHKVCLKLH